MKSNAVAVMGYPDKTNKYRLNSNRKYSTGTNSKNTREKQKQ